MRKLPLLLLSVVFLLGCGRSDVPREKYFSGHPVDHWLQSIRSADPRVRKKAADVLGNVGTVDQRSIPALIEAVKDRDPGVRDAAVLALSKIGPPASDAAGVLQEATQDTNAAVRSHATAALARVQGRS